jgi:RNA polymerase sigma factor (sigma-70 family)
MNIPGAQSISFFTPEYIKEIMSRIVKRGIQEEGWQPILDVVREMPCDEDFEKWDTKVRKDFLRKWYHTRSKRVQTVSLEACMEDEDNGIHEIADESSDFEEKVIAEDFCRRFKERLTKRDMEILELRIEGFTYEEIADKLGYKNHSGVLKRMKAIKKAFLKYEEEQQ